MESSKGIVLNRIKYGDSGLVVKIFTNEYGLIPFIIQGVRKKNTKWNSLLFQPFACLELVHYPRKNTGLCRLKEAYFDVQTETVLGDPRKTAIAAFLSEVLLKVLHEEEAQPEFYEYLKTSVHTLDLAERNLKVFCPWWLFKSAKFFGFQPMINYSGRNSFFNLESGEFVNQEGLNHTLSKEESIAFYNLFTSIDPLNEAIHRTPLLNAAVKFYQIHIPSFGQLKSLDVLRAVFN